MPARNVGRPIKGKPRQIRWTDEEWTRLGLAADRMGLSRSEYIRRVLEWDMERNGVVAPGRSYAR